MLCGGILERLQSQQSLTRSLDVGDLCAECHVMAYEGKRRLAKAYLFGRVHAEHCGMILAHKDLVLRTVSIETSIR